MNGELAYERILRMSKREKRWRVFYVIFMLFVYVIGVPIFLIDLFANGSISYGFLIFSIAVPFIRTKHINEIRQKER